MKVGPAEGEVTDSGYEFVFKKIIYWHSRESGRNRAKGASFLSSRPCCHNAAREISGVSSSIFIR